MATKHATEYLRGICYKIRMFGIPVDEPAFVHGENQSVLLNTTLPQYMLNKKLQSISFNLVREVCAWDEWSTAYINITLNVADLMTKPLSGDKRWIFIRILLHHI